MDDFSSHTERHAEKGPRDRWAQKQAGGLYGVLILGILGAFAFAYLGGLVAPNWRVEFSFVGFICGAVVYGLLAARVARSSSKDEYAQGNSRTEEEVRQALADIKAREK
ncbi:MAG: hypothetical protein ABJF86_14795 [Tateyamaria sp.]|uniref:GlsB/YeaQ/YmgE family stress response membrane protein n=1 Tax=Tateyamaria sp. TaxID=1929288 RepID=UPI00327FE472